MRLRPLKLKRRGLPVALLLSGAVAGGCLLFPQSRALAVGDVAGRIGGTVVIDATGDGLAGVNLSVRSPSLQGGAQTAVTDDNGNFIFQNLPPGEYELTVSVEGFATVKQRRILVFAGQQVPVDVRLQIQVAEPDGSQKTTVIEKTNPVLNTESAVAVTNFNNTQLTRTPNFRQFQSVAQLTPGVSQGTDQASVRGGLGRYNKFLVDGLDTSDIVTGGIASPMNFDAVEQFNIYVGAMDAEYNSLGLVQNVVTRTGGNKWVVDASLILAPQQLAASTSYAANSSIGDQGLLYPGGAVPVKEFYSGNLNIGGPLIKDRLWFYTSFQMNYNRGSTAEPAVPWDGVPAPTNRYQDTYTYLGRAKLTWQATKSTRLAFSFNLDRNYIRNSTGYSDVLPEADRRVDRGGHWGVILWDTLLTPKLLFQMQTGLTQKFTLFDTIATEHGQPVGTPDRITASHTINNFNDPFSGFTYLNSNQGWQQETKYNFQVNPSLLYTSHWLGTHNLKFGAQFSFQRYDNTVGVAGGRNYTDTVSGVPCNATWTGGSGGPAPLADATTGNPATWRSCNKLTEYPESAVVNGQAGAGHETIGIAYNIGFYAQDRWAIKKWLTVVPGFRVDAGILTNALGMQSLVGYGPRLSVIYDLFHDRSTLITAHYGRHNDVGNSFIANQGNPAQVANLYSWNPTTDRFTFVNTSGGKPANCSSDPTATNACPQTFGGKLTPPTLDEVAVGIKREIMSLTVIGIDYTYRAYRNMWVNEEVNQIWDPAGLKVIGYADGIAHQRFVAQTSSQALRNYNGLDLWVKGSPGNFDVTASYTLAFSRGTVDDYFDPNFKYNPRLTNLFYGPLGDTAEHYFKVLTSYHFDIGLDIGGRFQYISGGSVWKSFSSPQTFSYSLFRSPRGTTTGTSNNDPTTWANFNLPDQVDLDVQAGFNCQRLFHQNIDIIAMFFNVLNLGTATRVVTTNTQTFGTVTGRLTPFNTELVFRYRY